MSKIGKKPIVIPQGVEVKLVNKNVEIKGKVGSLTLPILHHITAKIENSANGASQLIFTTKDTVKQARANWGTMAALTKNAIVGVNQGFSKTLEIEGIGFKASLEGTKLVLNVGFTHPIKYSPLEGVKITVEKNQIKVFGFDKAAVGEVAASIRKIKKPEPYKGKGIHYKGEVVIRKAGKKVAGTGATS